MNKQPLVILTGPTAVGKTSLSIALAKAIEGEIISADSMQVYRGMDIGSAKILPGERMGVSHYLIDELEPDEEFHVVRFQKLAKKYMAQIYERGHIPILVGGTGFYIQAVLYDIDFTENDSNTTYRQELEKIATAKGTAYLHKLLEEKDPQSAIDIHPNNVKRVIRALEYYKKCGQPISEHNQQEREKKSPYDFVYFVLNEDRKILYKRIDERVDQMLTDGLVDEVRSLKDRGFTRDMVSMQGLGYKEILDYLDGYATLDEAVYRIKRDTRHFAMRQITWFKRERDVTWINKGDFENTKEILDYMLECVSKMIPGR